VDNDVTAAGYRLRLRYFNTSGAGIASCGSIT